MCRRSVLLAVWLSLAAAASAAGPLAVDSVTLKSGRPLRGAILSRQPDGTVLMAVSRDWLKQADPKEFDQLSQQSDDEQRAAWADILERIDPLLANPPKSQRLRIFYQRERERIAKLLKDDAPHTTLFLIREISGNHVGKLLPAAPERQRLAMFAWKEGLSKVEAKSAAELQKELDAAGIDIEGALPDLSDRLPVRKQSDAEWSARLAIVCYTFDESLDFQGQGDTLVRTGEGQQVDLAAILPKLLSRDVDLLLNDLFNPGGKAKMKASPGKNAYQSAIRIANQIDQRGFRVTRLDVQAERLAVSVQTEFVVRFADADWQPAWKHAESADGTQKRPEVERRIAADPQVKTLLESLKGLGLGADDAVTQAIRVGAATMAAQQAADAKFFEFRERYVKRLDGPVLPLAR